MNVLLHGLPDADIRKGDTIRDPKLVEDGGAMLFDRVIANPPFSLDEVEGGRSPSTTPVGSDSACHRRRYGDLAFVQHMVATTNGCCGYGWWSSCRTASSFAAPLRARSARECSRRISSRP